MPQSSIASYIGGFPPKSPSTYEVGAEFELFDGIIAGTVLSNIHKRSVLYIGSIGDGAIAKTAGRIRSRGVKVDLAETLTENTNIITNYGYADAKVLEDPDYAGKPLPNAPRHAGSLFLIYDIHSIPGNSALAFGGDGHGISRHSAANGINYYLPGYFVANAFAAYKMKLQYPVTPQLSVKNLFDKAYYTSSIATNNPDNQVDDPREAQPTVKMEF